MRGLSNPCARQARHNRACFRQDAKTRQPLCTSKHVRRLQADTGGTAGYQDGLLCHGRSLPCEVRGQKLCDVGFVALAIMRKRRLDVFSTSDSAIQPTC